MADALAATAGFHPRALIRHAAVSVLLMHEGFARVMGGRVYPNRVEHWFCHELPAAGLYCLSETMLESDISPDPDERRLSLTLEMVSQASERMDDDLDALSVLAEQALQLDALGAAMTALAEDRLGKPLPRDARGRSPLDACLLLLRHTGTEIGISVDGDRQMGMASLSFDLEYRWPWLSPSLADFLLAVSGWDVAVPDGHVDMESRVVFDPSPKE